MVIGPIQPGTFSPLTVSIPVLVSTFSTVPRNVCSLLPVVCAAAFEREFEADAAGPAGRAEPPEGPDCWASRVPIPSSELARRDGPAGESKKRTAADISKTANLDFISMTGLIANSALSESRPVLRARLEFFPGADSADRRDNRSEP